MTDFWLSCGHHFLDRDESGGHVVTDDFLKVYLAPPELIPPTDACPAECNLHRRCSPIRAGRSPLPIYSRYRRCGRTRELANINCVPRSSARA